MHSYNSIYENLIICILRLQNCMTQLVIYEICNYCYKSQHLYFLRACIGHLYFPRVHIPDRYPEQNKITQCIQINK